MAELSVEISARIDKLQKELAKAKGEFNSLEKSAEKTNSKLGKSSSKSAKGIDKLGKSAISGNSAMTAFSRTVQDAPFGIMGVSNNITNLTEQFGYLKNKTGSAGGALKAMLRDLKGFGGISLAISVATSLLVIFGDKIFKTKDKAKELREEQEKLTQALDDYVNGLESVSKANLKGEQSAQKELITLGLLKSQIENTNLSTNKRKDAIEALRKKYPDYLKNMSDEKILNGGLATTCDTLTTSIIKRAKATAASNMIVKNSEKLLVLETQLLTKQNEIADQKIALDAKDTASNRKRKSAGLAKDAEKLNKLKEEELKLIAKKQTLELTNIDLETNITALGGLAPDFITGDEIKQKVKALETPLAEGITSLGNAMPKLELAPTDVNWLKFYNLEEFEQQKLIMLEKLKNLNDAANNIIQNSLVQTFSGIGKAIGDALINGGNLAQGLGQALLGGIGGMLTQLGTLAIGVGIGIKKIKLALATLNPAVAIGAGVALVALGSAFSAGAAKIGNSGGSSAGGGGGVSSNTDTFSPSGGSSFSSSSGGGMQNVVFEIQGTKLVGVLSNTLQRNRNLGGSLSLT